MNIHYKWRFSSLGTSSVSMGHGFQFAMLVITRGYVYIISTKSTQRIDINVDIDADSHTDVGRT
jgi:ribosomal protein L31